MRSGQTSLVDAVIATDEGFSRAGERFPVVGMNAYYLLDETARELTRGEEPSTAAGVFAQLSALGVTVVRALACLDTPDGDICLQRDRGVYDEIGFRALDHVIATASRHGISLLLVLSNYWKDYGGVDQYLRWAGIATEGKGARGAFFERPEIRAHYRGHAERVLDRVNTISGIRYGDDATIFGWELMNEPRGEGTSAAVVREWVAEMAKVVRGGASQLLGTGESGYDTFALTGDSVDPDIAYLHAEVGAWPVNGSKGISFRENTALVDFASVHVYPESWGATAENAEAIGNAWIMSHVRVARELGRPLIIGEFGLINDDDFPERATLPLAARRDVYKRWLALAERGVIAGAFPWLFVPERRPSDWDRFSFSHFAGTERSDPRNKYVDLLASHAARMA